MTTAVGIEIAGRAIAPSEPPYVIAELSGNHNGELGRALDLVDAAADVGVDAVKLQTYRPSSLTLDSVEEPFMIGNGSPWAGRRLWDLYEQAQTPWEWTEPLLDRARSRGIALFSTPFDRAALDHLENLGMPAHKVASFELVDLDLVAMVAATGKPMILSTGMATISEIEQAVEVAREAGCSSLALLRCNSSYPAPADEMDLVTIPHLAQTWSTVVGLSDHTLTPTAATVAVALGACIIEKHLTLRRADGGPDAAFSLEPGEMADLVRAVTEAHKTLGSVRYGPSDAERSSTVFRRSLFIVEDLREGSELTRENVRSIRPGNGLSPAHLPAVLGRTVRNSVRRGTPLTWDLLA